MEVGRITSINDIQALVLSGFTDWAQFGHVTVRNFDDLLIFNYNQMAQYAEEWNAFEIMSRGLIIDSKTGEIVARSFDKFFNWGERGIFTTAPIVMITEKLDGSLGILYRKNGEYRIATRGSLESEQALWATDFLHHLIEIGEVDLSDLPNEYTLLFEIIYPENRVVVDYGDKEELYLLAVRNRFTGDYLPFPKMLRLSAYHGFMRATNHHFKSIDEMIANLDTLDSNEEGYVAEFADGQRFKFKGKQYLRLHKLLTRLSFKNMLHALEHGELGTFLEGIPDEFLGQAKIWIAEIEGVIESEKARLDWIFAQSPKEHSRRDFAVWVMENHKADSHYLFGLLDKRDLVPMIYKRHEWGKSEASVIKEET